MLSIAKPILQTQLLQILQKATYEMFMSQYAKNQVSEAQKYDYETELKMKQCAARFSQTFAQQASGPTATAIHNFVKEMGIMIIIPPSVVSPAGPVTGTIPMTNIQVL